MLLLRGASRARCSRGSPIAWRAALMARVGVPPPKKGCWKLAPLAFSRSPAYPMSLSPLRYRCSGGGVHCSGGDASSHLAGTGCTMAWACHADARCCGPHRHPCAPEHGAALHGWVGLGVLCPPPRCALVSIDTPTKRLHWHKNGPALLDAQSDPTTSRSVGYP